MTIGIILLGMFAAAALSAWSLMRIARIDRARIWAPVYEAEALMKAEEEAKIQYMKESELFD